MVNAPAEDRERVEAPNVKWQFAAAYLEDIRLKGEAFKSQGQYAETIGCSIATINKAIRNTPALADWSKRPVSSQSSAMSISDAILDKVSQQREGDPANMIEELDIDNAMAYLIENATPEERAKIHAMTPAEKRRLADAAYRDPDREDAILKTKRSPHFAVDVREHSRMDPTFKGRLRSEKRN